MADDDDPSTDDVRSDVEDGPDDDSPIGSTDTDRDTAPDPAPRDSAPRDSGSGDVDLRPGDTNQVSVNSLVGSDHLPKVFWRGLIAVCVAGAAFLTIRSVLGRLKDLIQIVIISLFVSFALEPVVNWLHQRGWRRGVATITCFLVVFGLGGMFIGVMTNLVVSQTSDLAEKAPDYLTKATDWLNSTFNTDITSKELNKTIAKYQDDLTSIAANVGGRALSITGSVLGTMFQALTVFLFSFYMIAEGPQFRRNVCSLLPERRQQLVLNLWELSIAKTGGWVYSRVLLAMASAITSWIAFSIIGLPSPLAMALWMGIVSQFIPVVGTYLGGALPVLIALINKPLDAIWVLGWIVVYQQIENYVLAPRITGHTMDLHPAVAFGAALSGVSLFGPVGGILALPAAAVIQAFVSSYLERHEVVDSALTNVDVRS